MFFLNFGIKFSLTIALTFKAFQECDSYCNDHVFLLHVKCFPFHTGQPGKPQINVNPATADGTVYINCRISQKNDNNISCYLYTGDTPEPFTSSWTTGDVCHFYIHNTDLQKPLESAPSKELSCDYTVNTDPPTRSPRSNKTVIEGE